MKVSVNDNNRPRRIVPATVVAVLVLALGAAAVTLVVLRWVDGAWPTALTGPLERVAAEPWGSATVWVGTGVVALLGLVLVLAALVPGRRRGLDLTSPEFAADELGSARWWVSHAALHRVVTGRAALVDGVAGADSRLRGHTVQVRVRPSAAGDTTLVERVRTAVEQHLQALGVDQVRRVRVRVGKEHR